MKKILMSAVLALVMSTGAYATKNDQTGCGLGAMIIKDDSTAVLLSLQATTNGTGFQTFAITSGTSGCTKTKLVMNERAEEFVASNMDQLAKEIAMGQGESVDTLAELLNVEDKAAFASALQANYNSIYATDKAKMADVLDTISVVAG